MTGLGLGLGHIDWERLTVFFIVPLIGINTMVILYELMLG
jgi:hypothetical protein